MARSQQEKLEEKRRAQYELDKQERYKAELEEFNRKPIKDWTALMKLWQQS